MDPGARRARIERLRSVPLFAQCSDETLDRILELATEVEVATGHVLTERGQPGAGLFVIEDGEVTVSRDSRSVTLGPGDFFGEMALLHEGAVRSARVAAATAVRFLAIARDDFLGLLHSEIEIAVAMVEALARRLVQR